MLILWIVRLAILGGAFYVHWALGLFVTFSLYAHMKNKARMYDQRFNLGLMNSPWYKF